jgi:serine/threonine-protein kinase
MGELVVTVLPGCPGPHELRLFLSGQVAGPKAEQLERHLAHCATCLRLAETLRLDDSLLQAARAATSADDPEDDLEPGLVERLCRLPAELPLDETPPLVSHLAPPSRLEAPVHFGPYTVVKELGSGGMGVVYLARDTRLRRLVALKLLLPRPGSTGELLARFRREAEVVARLQHPNIVQLYEAGEHDGSPYLVMEYVDGESLSRKLAASLMPARDAAELLEVMARAVDAAHQQGIIHRDLKPSNVLLTATGTPKVADFGLAKQLDPDTLAPSFATKTEALLGTPGYMAPEQSKGNAEVGPAADVYALGAILYECLTGRPPFRAASVLETLEQVRNQDPVPPGRLQPGVPRDLQTICLKCLEKEPGKRYTTARELADDLARFLRGEPILARPVSWRERLVKWTRRKPALAALAGVSLLALAGLVTGGVVYERQLRQALHEKTSEGERADANYREARDTVQRILDRASARGSAGIPRLEELRREQQEDALAFFLKLAEQQSDRPEVRFDVARACHQAGLLQHTLGRSEEAARNLRRAEELFAALADEFPGRGRYRFHLADTLKVLGGVVPLPPADGENCLRRALTLAAELAAGEPESVPLRCAEADVRITLASFLFNQRKAAEAEEHYRRAAAIYEELRREQPEAASHRLVLAKAYLNLSVLLQQGKRSSQELHPAREFHDKAEVLLEQLHREQPDNLEVLGSLVLLRVNWSFVQVAQKQQDAALADLAKNVKLLEPALKREPNHTMLRDSLLRTHSARREILEGQKRFAEAVEEGQRSVELCPDLPSADFRRLFLARVAARAGQHARADREIEDWKSRITEATPADQLSHCVGVYLLALDAVKADGQLSPSEREALVERYASRAVALLGILEERGYFKNLLHAGVLGIDPDYRPLRDRPDFRLLLEKVAGKKQ